MPKHKRLYPKVSIHKNSDSIPVAKLEFGNIELSTLIQFKDESEESSFYKALDLCVEQKDSTDGVDELFNPEGKIIKDGEKISKQLNIVYTGRKKPTLDDIPSISTKQDFIEELIKHLEGIDKPQLVKLEGTDKPQLVKVETLIPILAAKLFQMNKHLDNKKLLGKMLFLFASLCSVCARYEYQRDSMDSRRKLIDQKLRTIENLFDHGLVTGSTWSSAPFWNGVKSELMIEYNSIPETNFLSPFTDTFIQLNNVIKADVQFRKSLFNSVLYIIDTFKIFAQFSGYNLEYPKDERRRQITDRFRNLSDDTPGTEFEAYTPHQKI